MTLEQAGITYQPSYFVHMFLADTWVMFTLEVAVIGVMLWVASSNPYQNRILVYTLFGIEIVRGIVDDIYMLTRGYEPGLYIGWIVLHSIIILTGWWALRRAQAQPESTATPRKLPRAGHEARWAPAPSCRASSGDRLEPPYVPMRTPGMPSPPITAASGG